MTDPDRHVTLVLPVKSTSLAKSRLALPATERRRIALALAARTLEAAHGCSLLSRVVVVTSDPDVASIASSSGSHVVRDPAGGLNGACERGVAVARSLAPKSTAVVMVCDLPGITSRTLDAFLERVVEAGDTRVHVPDVSGRGTTAVSVPPDSVSTMVFGQDSASEFRSCGWSSLDDIDQSLRADLDTLADFDALPPHSRFSPALPVLSRSLLARHRLSG